MSSRAAGRWVVPGVCLLVGYLAGGLSFPGVWAQSKSSEVPAATAAPDFPMSQRIGANLWVENSGEYRACCMTIYRLAAERLEWVLHRTDFKPKRPAVVMDLDETVFDNSAFETYLYNNGLEYSDPLWEQYEEKFPQDVRAVPGAVEFIRRAESMGVTVVFISNRLEKYRDSTIKAIGNIGIDTRDIAPRLLLKPAGGSSDKSSRRDSCAARYNVLFYFGDNLRDFSEVFAAPKLNKESPASAFDQATAARLKQTDDASCHWGVDWFVLPNPVYGEWEKLIGTNPIARMRPTSMKVGS